MEKKRERGVTIGEKNPPQEIFSHKSGTSDGERVRLRETILEKCKNRGEIGSKFTSSPKTQERTDGRKEREGSQRKSFCWGTDLT